VDGPAFFSEYAINLTSVHFPALTARRRAHDTTDTEVLLLGDSHGWGQGSPGYDVILPAFSPHMAAPYSNGFYSRLRKHIVGKYGWHCADSGNRELFHPADAFVPVSGTYRRLTLELAAEREAAGFYAPDGTERHDLETWGYLATDNKFTEDLLVIAPSEEGNAVFRSDMNVHASKLYIGVVAGRRGAKLEVAFEQRGERKGLSAGFLYRISEGYPRITRVADGKHLPVDSVEAAVASGECIVLDTYRSGADTEVVYCIDFGQKQRGRLRFSYAGAHPEAVPFEERGSALSCPAIALRGVLFDGNDVRNFSMGGHTVGQWLGDGTPSFNDESQPHVDRLLRYVPFTPTLVVIQAPIVNEYLRQTPLAVFSDNLLALTGKLSRHLNEGGEARTDFLLLTTPGDKRVAFEGAPSAAIGYEAYYETVGNFARASGFGLIDFAGYFEDCVRKERLDYELLFDDPIHPSPFVNEFIARGLGQAVDLLM